MLELRGVVVFPTLVGLELLGSINHSQFLGEVPGSHRRKMKPPASSLPSMMAIRERDYGTSNNIAIDILIPH